MNIFRFLKSTKGAIKPLNALIISGVAGAGFFYVANTAANKQIAAERAIRSLSGISQTAPQAGMHRSGNMLTSINVRDGRNQLATAEERAAMEGNSALDRYAANQRALGSMDETLGRAAQFSDSDAGLNTGNRNTVQAPVQMQVGNPNAQAPVEDYVAPGGNSAARTPNRLSNASMTRAAGNSFGATAGGVTGGIAVQNTSNGREGRRLSGSMPGGSNIVSQRGLDGALASNRNATSFGQEREGRLGGGRYSKGERDELKDIVKRSADAASNANASANEGGRAFLANAVNSGGVNVNGGEDTTRGASSGDLAAPTKHKLKAIGNKLNNVDTKLQKMKADQKRLITQLITVVLFSIAMMILGAWFLPMLKSYPWIRWSVAGLMMAAVAGANAYLFVRAAEFMDRYKDVGGTGIAELALVLSPIMVAGMVFTAINPEGWKNLGDKILGNIKKAFEPVGLLTGQVTNGITGLFK